ncbi:MAG: polysaccharide deacetylase family protein [Bryobacteraceae bacterium]
MPQVLRQAVKRLAYSSATNSALRRMLRGTRIISYHRFPPEFAAELQRQCEHFRKFFHPITLDTFVDALRNHTPLPPNSLVITVDDGYIDSYSVAAPIFRRYEIPATVYLVTDFLDQATWLWWDQLQFAFVNTRKTTIDLTLPNFQPQTLELGPLSNRQDLATQCSIALLRNDCQDVDSHLQIIFDRLDVSIPSRPPAEFLPLSWDHVRQMPSSGFSFGSHTVSHHILGIISSWEQRRREIFDSKRRIEEMTGHPVRHFCFPNGGVGDFSHTDINLIRAAGYHSAATLFIGVARASSDPFLLPRITLNPDLPFDFFRMKLAGLWYFQGGMNQPHRLPVRFPSL